MAKTVTEVRIPFAQMSFTPDVPSTALGPNEYNAGLNVETDVRGIRSVAGDEEILQSVPGTPTFVTGGFRLQNEFWFIVATTEGYWYASNGTTNWYNITPGGGPIAGYNQATNITEAWNGTVPMFNDTVGPPMFWPNEVNAVLVPYSNTLPVTIVSATSNTPTTVLATFETTSVTAPFAPGEQIIVSGTNNYFNGVFTVVSSTTNDVEYLAVPGASSWSGSGTISAKYTWNYNPNWYSYYANFMRIYSTPNVGSILVAGDLTVTPQTLISGNIVSGSSTIVMPDAVDSLLGGTVIANGVPTGSVVTTVNVGANVVINGNATTTQDYVSMAIVSANTINYPVTVQWSQSFGLNEAPLTWQPTITNVANQLEVPLRGPALDAFPCNGQFFLCSYWDTVVFSPINYSTTSAPILGIRQFNQGRGLLSSNCWANTDKLVYGVDARDIWVFDGQDFKGLGNQRVKNWFYDQLDPQYYDRVFMETNTQRSQVEIYYPDANAVGGVPNKMISYRYDLDCWNAPREVTSATFACEAPIFSGNTANLGSRTVVYARGEGNVKIIQKDQGYSFVSSAGNTWGNIASQFRRDNIKMLKDYSGKIFVHRILPEVVNLSNNELPVDPAISTHKGNITVTIEGANSVGSAPIAKTPVTIPIDADGATNSDQPWAQINQNAFRVNSLELSNSSNVAIWMCSATTWQFAQVEDDK